MHRIRGTCTPPPTAVSDIAGPIRYREEGAGLAESRRPFTAWRDHVACGCAGGRSASTGHRGEAEGAGDGAVVEADEGGREGIPAGHLEWAWFWTTRANPKEEWMMRRSMRLLGRVLAVAGFGLLLGATAHASTVEVLDHDALAAEMRLNPALRMHVEHSGYPDLAQRWQINSGMPWSRSLVRLIYLDAAKEMGFSRTYVLGLEQYGLLRYRRTLSDELAEQTRQYLATAAPMPTEGFGTMDAAGAADRAEMAANRAERAAEASEQGAASVEATAKRLEDMATQAEQSFRQQIKK